MEIKAVTEANLKELQAISIATFIDAFGAVNTPEDMEAYIRESRSLESLRKQLYADSEFYFLEVDDQTIGYLKINYGLSQTEPHLTNCLEVQQVYIIKEYQNKGLGKLLLDEAIQRGLDMGLDYIWLGVWEHNTDAIRFYERLGFRSFVEHSFILGSDHQTDILMKKPLEQNKDQRVSR